MIILIFLQSFFILLFLHFVKVSVLFHLLVTGFKFFPFLQYDSTCVFFAGTSSLGVFKHFALKVLHTLSAFCIKLSLSSSTPLVNPQSVLSKAVVCILVSGILHICKHRNCISKGGHKFFHNPQGS